MKNKNLIIGFVILTIVVVGGGVLVLSSGKKTEPVPVDQIPVEDRVSTIKPEDIGLVLSTSSDNRKVILEISKIEGLSALDYELSYISKGDIPRGIIGHIDIEKTQQKVNQPITLGTCSDVCHYDEDVTDIKLILKVTKTDGTTSQVEKSL